LKKTEHNKANQASEEEYRRKPIHWSELQKVQAPSLNHTVHNTNKKEEWN